MQLLVQVEVMGQGQKRKLPEAPEGGSAERGSVVYELQRQSVLDLSLDKFQRCQTLAEPRLLHSVLITNTLRHIQEEIRQEAPPPAPPRGTPEPHPQGEAPPTRPPASSRPVGLEDAGEDWMALSSEEDFSLSSAVCSILKDLDTVIDGGLAVPRPPLGSIENLPGEAGPRREGGAGPRRAERCSEGCRAPEGAVFGSLEVMRSSYLRDVALDDLFLDIDTSAYERDAAPLGARTLSGAAGDELLKFLPALASSAASPFPHSPSARDLNDLEHIMEILVGS
ncbi:SERTA domain-containing protein 3 isoform X1 [Anguilla anguilla]|uniref:SERTA domain-containing protein 3 isoform X1 n=2 Tax=Anguilla anguilla TaxID=7936 RepID=UPI0015ABC8A3|nr:SERTA domain-containing protein 3 isoform X1 [Anguilla anguilla]